MNHEFYVYALKKFKAVNDDRLWQLSAFKNLRGNIQKSSSKEQQERCPNYHRKSMQEKEGRFYCRQWNRERSKELGKR